MYAIIGGLRSSGLLSCWLMSGGLKSAHDKYYLYLCNDESQVSHCCPNNYRNHLHLKDCFLPGLHCGLFSLYCHFNKKGACKLHGFVCMKVHFSSWFNCTHQVSACMSLTEIVLQGILFTIHQIHNTWHTMPSQNCTQPNHFI